jgi:hypothetical protein
MTNENMADGPIWKSMKFIAFAKAILWDLQKLQVLKEGTSLEEVEEIFAKRGWNITKDAMENGGLFPPGILPPYADLPLYKEELDKLYPDAKWSPRE